MTTPAKSSVRVVAYPFENLTGKKELDYFVSGFSEDIVTDLSRFRGLNIISARAIQGKAGTSESGQVELIDGEYVLRGSFNAIDDRLRIRVNLLQGPRKIVLWADRYDEMREQVYAIQDDIVRKIVKAVQKQIDFDLLANSYRKDSNSLEAYDLWLRGMDALKKGSIEDDEAARRYFEQALLIDKTYSRAYTGLSLSYFNEWSCQLWDRWDVSKKGAQDYALKAVNVDPNDYIALTVLARTLLYDEQYDMAEYYIRRSIDLNPGDSDNLVHGAAVLTYLGHPDEAERLFRKALDYDPFFPNWYLGYGVFIYFETGDYQRVLDIASQVITDNVWADFNAFVAAAHYKLGDIKAMWENWRRFEEVHRERVLKSDDPDTRMALDWFVNLNPYRSATNLSDFWDFLSTEIPEEGTPGPSREHGQNGDGTSRFMFMQSGDSWELAFNGRTVHLKDIKGLHDIREMLRRPFHEFHCTELMGAAIAGEGTIPMVDETAKKAYRQRIAELREAIEESGERQDFDSVAKYTREYEALIDHLSASVNIKGKTRVAGSVREKARSAVTWRIRSAIRKIAEVHPVLGRHLENAIKTGTTCSYNPDQSPPWVL